MSHIYHYPIILGTRLWIMPMGTAIGQQTASPDALPALPTLEDPGQWLSLGRVYDSKIQPEAATKTVEGTDDDGTYTTDELDLVIKMTLLFSVKSLSATALQLSRGLKDAITNGTPQRLWADRSGALHCWLYQEHTDAYRQGTLIGHEVMETRLKLANPLPATAEVTQVDYSALVLPNDLAVYTPIAVPGIPATPAN